MVDDPLKQLGETFKKARLQSGLSIEDLSEKSRIQERHIKNIEKANRVDLPEEAYLMGFLNKLAKVLKLKNPQAVIDEYKNGESQYIVQNILNENHIKKDSFNINISFLKIYHLYILIAALVVFGIFYLFNSSSSKEFKKDKDLITISKLETRKPIVIPEKKETEEDLVIKIPKEEPEKNNFGENSSSDYKVYGEGSKILQLSIIEVSWFQVYGIAAGKVLFEGDAYPNVKPNNFKFKDDIGFALASGNAGAFKIYDSGKKFILGESGQLIKWYYPEGAKYEYKQRVKH
jgi:transcriptional regulator with XRE-family HTH domain